jgi:hypothetical protein
MNKFGCFIRTIYHIATVIGMAFAMWKLVHYWRAGMAEKTGHAIDASISAAAKQLEITADLLEKWADTGLGENVGKGLDEVLADTKKTLDKATELVQVALNHAQ